MNSYIIRYPFSISSYVAYVTEEDLPELIELLAKAMTLAAMGYHFRKRTEEYCR